MREFVKNYDNFINEELDTEIYNDETEEFDEELYEAYLEDEEVINELFGINKAIKKKMAKIRSSDKELVKSHTDDKDARKKYYKYINKNTKDAAKISSGIVHTGAILGIGAIGFGLYKSIKGLINMFKSLDEKEEQLKANLEKETNPEKRTKIKEQAEKKKEAYKGDE